MNIKDNIEAVCDGLKIYFMLYIKVILVFVMIVLGLATVWSLLYIALSLFKIVMGWFS